MFLRFGGNFRAVEWLHTLLAQDEEKWDELMARLKTTDLNRMEPGEEKEYLTRALEEEWKEAHRKAGNYYRYLGESVTRLLNDEITAIEHYRRGEAHQEADELSLPASGDLYRYSYFKKALELLEPLLSREDPGFDVLNRAGQCYFSTGDYQKALTLFENSLPLLEQATEKEDRENLATTLHNISQIYDARGDYDKALSFLRQSLDIRQEIGDKQGLIVTLHNMAHLRLQNEDLSGAEEEFKQALTLAVETQSPVEIYDEALTYGSFLLEQERWEEALPLLAQAYELGKQIGRSELEEWASIFEQGDRDEE